MRSWLWFLLIGWRRTHFCLDDSDDIEDIDNEIYNDDVCLLYDTAAGFWTTDYITTEILLVTI